MKISLILAENKFLAGAYRVLLLFALKIFRGKKLFRSGSRRTVIINFHRLGDSVFTIPAVKEVLKHFSSDIYIFCFEETKPIFEKMLSNVSIITFGKSDFHLNFRISGSAVRKKLSELNPGRIIDITGSTLSASVLFSSTANEIIGSNEVYYKDIYTRFTKLRTDPHVMDIYLDTVRLIIPGIDDSIRQFNTTVNKNGYLLIHPFAGWTAKEWNIIRFIELAEKLNNRYRTIIVAEPGKITPEIKQEIILKEVEVIETHNINELMKVIDNCSLFISNDSGPLYIANMLGKPTFTLYGPTNPVFSLPFGKNHRYIQRKIKCSPKPNEQYCFTNGGRQGCPSFECMRLLETDEVIDSLSDFIKELGISKKTTVQNV